MDKILKKWSKAAEMSASIGRYIIAVYKYNI